MTVTIDHIKRLYDTGDLDSALDMARTLLRQTPADADAWFLLGKILWWYAITFFVNKVRAHINVRSLWLINKAIGSLLMIMACVGVYFSIEGWIG